jgi:predicted short-subunit dehydrogenase-like oxidoreductase (DUF2520 family)
MKASPTFAIVGAGRLATDLALALHDAGFSIQEIVCRNTPRSRSKARKLAAKVGARAVTGTSASLDATVLWLCVPDREIRATAAALTARNQHKARFVFHSSGALLSDELNSFRSIQTSIASVHPLMTFVAGSHPSLKHVPFALEGDGRATRAARRIVHALGGESFLLPADRKVAYHAWATMTSPLLLAFLVTLEEMAGLAGLSARQARRKSLPIILQTVANYSRLGPARSFSGPLVRGDAETVARHLELLKNHRGAREVYVALARAARRGLPVKNRSRLERLLQT